MDVSNCYKIKRKIGPVSLFASVGTYPLVYVIFFILILTVDLLGILPSFNEVRFGNFTSDLKKVDRWLKFYTNKWSV